MPSSEGLGLTLYYIEFIWVEKDFSVEQIFGPKIYLAEKIFLVEEFFWSKMVENVFG